MTLTRLLGGKVKKACWGGLKRTGGEKLQIVGEGNAFKKTGGIGEKGEVKWFFFLVWIFFFFLRQKKLEQLVC